MNDVDFLPHWYIENRQRRQSVQRQYIILATLFLVMIVWNSMALRSIKRVSAEVAINEPQQRQAERVNIEYQDLKGRIEQIDETVLSLEKLDSRVDVASILAELSVLVNNSVVFTKVELLSVPYGQKHVVGTATNAETEFPFTKDQAQQFSGWSQISVFLRGVAETPGEVAELMRALEGSTYFSEVHLRYSQHAAGRPQGQGDEPISGPSWSEGGVEFAIDCLLAHIKRANDAP